MKASKKSPGMEKLITALTGVDRVAAIEADICIWAGDGKTHNLNFKDGLSLKEYSITAMCQTCQDKLFSEPEY